MKLSLTRSDLTLRREEDRRGGFFSIQIESFVMRYWCEYHLQLWTENGPEIVELERFEQNWLRYRGKHLGSVSCL